MTTTDLHSLLAPYALDALDAHERSQFEAHLDQCADCRDELAGFLETSVRLGQVTEQAPPVALRERILAQASATPQERPVVVALAQRGRLRRTLPRLAMAAAFLVGTVGVGGYVVERDRATQATSQNVAMTSVLSSPDAKMAAATWAGGDVHLVSSKQQDAAVITAKGLKAPAGGKVYQVWMIDADGPTSQGTFTTDGTMLMKGVSDADTVAVTVEPKGGSKRPTTPPIASIDV